jgi:regulatory protein
MRRFGRNLIDAEKSAESQTVLTTAIGLLARRDFASGELRRKLEERGFVADVVTAVLAELTEERKLDDARFAANFVAYHAERGQGPVRIRKELRDLGVAEGLIEEAFAAGPDFRVLARQVRQRKFGAAVPEEWAEKARQARFLQYRGFSSDHIRAALGADFDPDT